MVGIKGYKEMDNEYATILLLFDILYEFGYAIRYRELWPDPCLPLHAKTFRRCRVRDECKVGEGNVMENAS